MDVAFENKAVSWRGRGHPRREIPQPVKDMADGTLNTGRVGVVRYGEEDIEDVRELKRLLRSYAKGLGLRMRIQDGEGVLRFELADTQKKGSDND